MWGERMGFENAIGVSALREMYGKFHVLLIGECQANHVGQTLVLERNFWASRDHGRRLPKTVTSASL